MMLHGLIICLLDECAKVMEYCISILKNRKQ